MLQQQIAQPVVDRSALRVNQGAIVLFIVAAYLLQLPMLVGFVAAVMLVGTIVPQAALFQQFYRKVLGPSGLIKPDVHAEDATQHRFAQGMGAAFLVAATVAFVVGAPLLAWVLSTIVAILAGVNLVFGFCAGCFVYFHLARSGVIKRSAA